MIVSIIKQELLGVIILAIPLGVLYYVFPRFIFSFLGIVLCSLGIGIYLALVNYQATKKTINQLMFIPSGQCKKLFEDEIVQCGLQVDNVSLRYGYADDGIALTMFNVVIVDQMVWKNIESDPEACKAKNLIEYHILPAISAEKKALHDKINKSLSPDVQRFIFKHELGHVFYN